MAGSLRATSTTLAALHAATVRNSEETESTNSSAYVLGIILFGVIFVCGFVLALCQVKGSRNKDKREYIGATISASPQPPAASTSLPVGGPSLQLGYGDLGLLAVPRASTESATISAVEATLSQASHTLTLFEPHICSPEKLLLGGATVASAGDLPSLRTTACPESQWRWHDTHLIKDSQGLNSWVGSHEWASARASRKRQVQKPPPRRTVPLPTTAPPTLDVPQVDVRDTRLSQDSDWMEGWLGSPAQASARAWRKKQVQKPTSRRTPPPLPAMPPPTLDVPSAMDLDCLEAQSGASGACATVHEQLTCTAKEELSVRKKIFKGLCARWHPDKHLQANTDLATEVFQYLQTQKAWYLLDHASVKSQPQVIQ